MQVLDTSQAASAPHPHCGCAGPTKAPPKPSAQSTPPLLLAALSGALRRHRRLASRGPQHPQADEAAPPPQPSMPAQCPSRTLCAVHASTIPSRALWRFAWTQRAGKAQLGAASRCKGGLSAVALQHSGSLSSAASSPPVPRHHAIQKARETVSRRAIRPRRCPGGAARTPVSPSSPPRDGP